LVDIDFKLGKFKQALLQYQNIEEMCKSYENRSKIYIKLINFYIARGQIFSAIENINLIINEAPTPLDIIFTKLQYAYLYIKIGKPDLAIQTISNIGKIPSPYSNLPAWAYLRVYSELEDADNAEKFIEDVKSLMDSTGYQDLYSEILNAQSKINEVRGEYDQAIINYQEQLKIDPTKIAANVNIGRSFRKLEKYKKAEESFKKVLKIEPFNPEANYEIALLYWEMGKKEKALEHISKTLYVWEEADPEYKPAIKAREKLSEWEST
jgi:tetratricopeptide (TPR) repeat protein